MINAHSKASNTIETALGYFKQGQLDKALTVCNELLQYNSHDINVLNLAGIISDAQQQKQLAVNYFQRAIELSPNNPQLLTNLAGTLIDLQEIQKAKSYLLLATKPNSNYAEAFYNLGNIFILENNFPSAREAFERAIVLQKNHFKALNNLATVYKSLEKTDLAKHAYLKAIEINPRFVEALVGLGSLYFREKQFSEAEKYLTAALAVQADHDNANYLLGTLYLNEYKDEQKALAFLNAAYNASSDNEVICNELGAVQFRLGDMEKAKSLFIKSLSIKSDQINALNFLGQIHHELRQHEKSIQYYQQALAIDPQNTKVMNNLGHVLREQGDLTQAIDVFRNAIDIENQKNLPLEQRSTAINNLALTELLIQDFENGWRNYCYRPSIIEGKIQPLFTKENINLRNKRILWLQDQGIGDELFFLRFTSQLASLNTTSNYRCSEKIKPLLQPLAIFHQLYDNDDYGNEYDYIFSIADLPYLLGHHKPDGTPSPLTLQPDSETLTKISVVLQQFGPPPYIGITWKAGRLAANKRVGAYHKHIELHYLCQLLKNIEGTIISVQVNPSKEDLEYLSVQTRRPILDVSAWHNQLDKMLCLLDKLDNYFAVSNTYVHMREGLHKDSHVFVSHPPEWRWLASGNKSFWFPNSIAYRQSQDGSWKNAIEECRYNLECLK